MKLVTFSKDNISRIGIVVNDEVVDTKEVSAIPDSMIGFLTAGQEAMDAANGLLKKHAARLSLSEVQLEAPIPQPSKYLAVSLNYLDHIQETGKEKPEHPTFFNKQTSCVVGPGAAIHRPRVSKKLDYEGELAFVIGKRCRHVPKDRAHEVIAGYMIANDVSVRDWQIRSHTWTLGKSFDTHGPTGPWIVTPDEISDPHKLKICTWLNDELRQSSNTDQLICNCYEIIEYLTTVMTLLPGDIIATGTSSGVGVAMKPRGYMKPGDIVKIEIENIGTLINPIIEEPENTVLINS